MSVADRCRSQLSADAIPSISARTSSAVTRLLPRELSRERIVLRTASAGAYQRPPHDDTPSAARVHIADATPRDAASSSRTSCAAAVGAKRAGDAFVAT